jgi:carbohydrate-selective porin OprB
LSLGHFEGDADWQKFFKYGLYIAQVAIRTDKALGLDPKAWVGHYRLYGWINNREHRKFAEKGQLPVAGSYVNYGFGVSCDQMITKWLDVFGRAGWQRPNVIRASGGATIEWSWSAGAQINGCYWKRIDDRFAFAIGQNFVSKEYIDAGNPGSNEGHVEFYYACKLNPCLTISPDIQFIWNPNGVSSSSKGDADTIFVYGTRLHYVF